MNKYFKKILLASSFLCSLTCFSIAIPLYTKTQAQEPVSTPTETISGFNLENGASIRKNSNDNIVGIRFKINLGKAKYDEIKGNGNILTLKAEVTTTESQNKAEYSWNLNDSTMSSDQVFYATLNFNNLNEVQKIKATKVEFAANAYIDVDNDVSKKIELDNKDKLDNTRSMRAVAAVAIEKKDCTNADLKGYIGTKTEATETLYYETERESKLTDTTFDSIYMGAKKANTTGVIEGKKLGETYNDMYLFDKDNNYKKVSYKYVSRAIRDGNDLKYFNDVQNPVIVYDADKNIDKEKSRVFDGYYVLTNNVDGSNFKPGDLRGMGVGENASKRYYFKDFGLVKDGVFDGQGYTINNFYYGGSGLFGLVAGTVKNLGIDITKGDRGSYAKAGLAYVSYGTAVYDNIFMKIVDGFDMGNGSVLMTRSIQNKFSKATTDTTMKNIVVKATIHHDADGQSPLYWNERLYGKYQINTQNVFVISPYCIIDKPDKTHIELDKNNKEITVVDTYKGVMDGENKASADTFALKGVKRYVDYAEMEADKANNDYSSFDTRYWDVSSGRPVWKTAK